MYANNETAMSSRTITPNNLLNNDRFSPSLIGSTIIAIINANANANESVLASWSDTDGVVNNIKQSLILRKQSIEAVLSINEPPFNMSKQTGVAWVQYLLSRASLCAGDIIEGTDKDFTFCNTENNALIAQDLNYVTRVTNTDGVRDGLLACLTEINSNIFVVSDKTINVTGCNIPLDLSQYYENMLPVILNIYFMYAGAYRIQTCGGPGVHGRVSNSSAPLSTNSLYNMLRPWQTDQPFRYTPELFGTGPNGVSLDDPIPVR